jgi:hypothetical protein
MSQMRWIKGTAEYAEALIHPQKYIPTEFSIVALSALSNSR